MTDLTNPVTTVDAIYKAYEEDADNNNRPHLGASLIGHPCERYLWLTFRWVEQKEFSGRLLRLFETGHLAESRFIANLQRIGVEVHAASPDGQQWRVSSLGGHFGGSMDAAGRGFPEAPSTWAVIEFKTHNEKSFTELVKKKVQAAKPQHYAQMQVYMGETQMEAAMYVAVNKNTDQLYAEWVLFDQVEFVKLKERAERVIRASEPPLRISSDPSWFVCKMCDFADHCHGDWAPAANCRTCAHSTPELEGDCKWSCQADGGLLDLEFQRHGCAQHRYIPIMLERFATQSNYVNGDVFYTDSTGLPFANGQQPHALSSQEICDLQDKSMLGAVANLKQQVANQGFASHVVK